MPLKSPRQLSLSPSFPLGCHPLFREKVPLMLMSIQSGSDGTQANDYSREPLLLLAVCLECVAVQSSAEGLAADVRDVSNQLGFSCDARDPGGQRRASNPYPRHLHPPPQNQSKPRRLELYHG